MRPSGPKTTWDVLRDRAHEIARKLESDHPDLVVSNMRRSLRGGGSSSTGARTIRQDDRRRLLGPGDADTTVSTPVSPAEVRRCAEKNDPYLLRFETDDVLRRIDKDGDLFAPLGLH